MGWIKEFDPERTKENRSLEGKRKQKFEKIMLRLRFFMDTEEGQKIVEKDCSRRKNSKYLSSP